MKVVHLCQKSRASFGIMQGLIVMNFDVCIEQDYISKGNLILEKTKNIHDDLIDCDLIFMGDFVSHEIFISKHKLWNKVIFYDYRDNVNLQEEAWQKASIYFKRSWFDSNRNKIVPSWVLPLSHCALDEYYDTPVDQNFDIGCFFDINNKNIGCRRRNILIALQSVGFKNSLIGSSTAFGGYARLSIENSTENNPFYEFLAMQKQCKIIFTAQPEKVEGDNRTWEAFASGGLVFRDVSHLPLANTTINGIHCIVYDATDMRSIYEAIDQARYFSNNEKERLEIALAGYDHVKKYHRPVNRVKEMIDIFESRPKIF